MRKESNNTYSEMKKKGDFLFFLIIAVICLNNGCKNHHTLNYRYSQIKAGFDSVDIQNKHLLSLKGYGDIEDSARLWLYLKNCTEKLICRDEFLVPPGIYLAYLDMKLISFNLFKDTLELSYQIVYNDTLPINVCFENSSMYPQNSIIEQGVSYNIKTKQIIGYLSSTGAYYIEFDSKGNFRSPDFKSRLQFVSENKNRINPWFLDQLIKRKYIQK